MYNIPGFLKARLHEVSKKINSFTIWQFKTVNEHSKADIENLYLTPGSELVAPRSI